MADLRVSFPEPCDEKWEAMAPTGCGRMCGSCDTVVHDLSAYDLAEAEALLRREPKVCVRAKVAADGTVALRRGSKGTGRRMVVAAAVTAGLLATAQPAFAKADARGVIAGKVNSFGHKVRIQAKDAEGRTFRTKAKPTGGYKLKHLPAGTYTLIFTPECGTAWTVADVVVGEGKTIVPVSTGPDLCIVVGMLQIEGSSG